MAWVRSTPLTADGEVTGTFVEGTISAILSQSFTYRPAVIMQIDAASYRSAISGASAVRSYAACSTRTAACGRPSGLDFANAQTIQSTFDGLAPVSEPQAGGAVGQNLQTFNANRLRESTLASSGGTIARGRPIHTADMSVSRGSQPIVQGYGARPGGRTHPRPGRRHSRTWRSLPAAS